MRKARNLRMGAALMLSAGAAACGSGDGGSGPASAILQAARANPSGNNQTGMAGRELTNPLRIVVTRGGVPVSGAAVTWSTTVAGAFMTPPVDSTDANGIASSIWHLGNEVGSQASQAVVEGGAEGSPVTFAATVIGDPASGVTIQLVESGGNRFEPANVTIPAGTKVTWIWVGGFHDVTSAGEGTFPSSGAPVSPPHSYSFTFLSPGTYLYFCSVHGTPSNGMRGTIVVQ